MVSNFMAAALAVGISGVVTPVCEDRGHPQIERQIGADMQAQAEWERLMQQRERDNQRRVTEKIEQLGWEADKTRQEVETLQTQRMLRIPD